MSSPRRWAAVGAAIVSGTLLAAWIGARSPTTRPDCFSYNICDGLTFRAVGEILVDGGDPYDSARRAHQVASTLGTEPPFDLPFQYPPPALPLFALRAIGPALPNAVLTTAATTALGLSALAALWRRDPMQPLWVALAATWAVTWFNALLAQTGALAVALAAGTLALAEASPVVAGVLLGGLSFKPHYAVPIALAAAAGRQWRLLGAAASTVVALCVLSTLLWGPRIWPDALASLAIPNDTAPFMVSWLGIASHVVPGAVHLVLPVFAAGIVLVTSGSFHAVRLGWRWETVASGALGTLLLFSPNTHPYDLFLALPALVLVVPRGRPTVPVAFACVAWLATLLFLGPPNRWAFVVVLAGLAVTWAIALARDAEPGRQRTESQLPPAR